MKFTKALLKTKLKAVGIHLSLSLIIFFILAYQIFISDTRYPTFGALRKKSELIKAPFREAGVDLYWKVSKYWYRIPCLFTDFCVLAHGRMF